MRDVQLEQLEQSCVALLRNRVSERSTSMASVRSRGIDPCATLSYAVLTAAWAPKYVIGREQRFELQLAPAMGDRTDVAEVGATQLPNGSGVGKLPRRPFGGTLETDGMSRWFQCPIVGTRSRRPNWC